MTSPGEKCPRSVSEVRRAPAKSLLRHGASPPPGLCCVLDPRAYEAHCADTGHDLEDSSPHVVSTLVDQSRGTAGAASLPAWPQAAGVLTPSCHAPTPGAGRRGLPSTIHVPDSPCRRDSGGICVWTCLTQGYSRAICWGLQAGALGFLKDPHRSTANTEAAPQAAKQECHNCPQGYRSSDGGLSKHSKGLPGYLRHPCNHTQLYFSK